MNNDSLWQTKLHARLHDPAEKALVLLRDPAGHEGGTSRSLHRLLGYHEIDASNLDADNAEVLHQALFKNGIPAAMYRAVKRADWWAAAADRPQWPMQAITVQTHKGDVLTLKVAPWAQVRWSSKPVLIHPLTGAENNLGKFGGLSDTEIGDIKSRSFDHFEALVQRRGSEVDWCATQLAFWRFGPSLKEEQDNDSLGALWPLLPADTRVPDHSIWDHLDITSAFAGAFADDPSAEAAMLTVALGPVQSFIEAARSTSDLWAGSHLLARLAWEAMKPVCQALGPDAIVFPRLRGVPQIDLWLRDECGLPASLFEDCDWRHSATDANPLFAAALPNRFVAIVPAAKARLLAEQVEAAVRAWLQGQGQAVVNALLDVAGMAAADGSEQHCHQQMREQLAGFPEVHWAVVPFALARPRNAAKQNDLDTRALSEAMAPFYGSASGAVSGFLDSPAWKVLNNELHWDDNTTFWSPNPGALYPAVHDLAERVLAAAKAARSFAPLPQQGWRCSLTGETEWLTTDPAQLNSSYRQRTDTLWARVAAQRPAWAKSGEHLGALPAIKRLWPTLFAQEVGRALSKPGSADEASGAQRFVVSTHTMALARQLDQWLQRGGPRAEGLTAALNGMAPDAVALPQRLMRRHAGHAALADAKRLPALLDAAAETENEARAKELRRLVSDTLRGPAAVDAGLETYYGMLMLDGDHMGKWLGGEPEYAIRYCDSFHPDVRKGFDQHAERQPLLRAYAAQARAMSPNRHMAISSALNDFSLCVARHVIEREHLGRLIYAGGDDVLAMLPVADLLPAMQRLRLAYSGHDPEHERGDRTGLALRNGFALLDGESHRRPRLMRMMGERATASCGAVIAHHQAPLGAVLRELRAAEQRAKGEGGRDAFSLSVIKRSGGALRVSAKWGEPVNLLGDLRRFLADDGVSRRAVYNSFEWLKDLPPDRPDMLRSLLAYQLDRQADKAAKAAHKLPELASRLTALAFDPQLRPAAADPLRWLQHYMSAAEFLAREIRGQD